MIFMHQMERHQSQVNGPGPSAESHPFIHLGKKGRSVAHSAQHTPMLGLVMQRLYILTFAMVCLRMRACPCVSVCAFARERARGVFHTSFLSAHTHSHHTCRFLRCFAPSINKTASFGLADRTCNGVCITSLTD